MAELEKNCRALYEEAFGISPSFDDALFRYAMPQYLRVIAEGDAPRSMLFSIPYALVTENGKEEARYLYAVATAKDHRGKGLAKALLKRVIAEGQPLFLRPSSPSLFAFYQAAGLTPVSPVQVLTGEAEQNGEALPLKSLSPTAYLAAREAFLKPPYAVPTADFLALGYLDGGALALAGEFVAFYEMRGDRALFKEWLGNTAFAPRVAAYLGANRYELRTPCAEGTPFGVAANCPKDLAFLIALD